MPYVAIASEPLMGGNGGRREHLGDHGKGQMIKLRREQKRGIISETRTVSVRISL